MEEKIKQKISEIIEGDFGIYPNQEIIKSLNKMFEENRGNAEVQNSIFAETSLINDLFTFGDQIPNIWRELLSRKKSFLTPLNGKNKEWKEEYLDYYKNKYKETKSPFVKSRYAFAILTLLKGQDRFNFSRECFDSWFKGIEFIYRKLKEDYKNKILDYDLLGIWTSLGIKLIASLDMKEKVGSVLNFIEDFLKNEQEELLKLDFLEGIANYIDNLSVYGKDKVESIKRNIESFCNNQINIYSKQKLFPSVGRHAKLLSNIKPGYDSEVIIARNFEQDAESREEPLIKCHLWENSIKEYQLLQNKYSDKNEEIKIKIDELKEKIVKESKKIKYKEFGYELEIKKEEIENLIKYYESRGDLFKEFIKSNDFIPKISEIKKQNEILKKEHPISFYFPHTTTSRFGPISKYSSEKEILELKYRKHYSLGIQISSLYLGGLWERIEQKLGGGFYDKIFNLFHQEELSEINEFLTISINHFKNKDHVSSIHVLMPYIEEIIRMIIRKSGNIDNILRTEKDKFFRKIEFGTLIKKEIVKKILGEDFVESLNVFLLMDDQFNLRNILSHGLISKQECNQYNNVYLIYLALKLIYILKNLEIKNK